MADLTLRPGYTFTEADIITVEKLNLLGTPTVELQLADRVDDQSFLRNGNFYSSFWTTPAGINCPPGVETTNANYWIVKPLAGTALCRRSSRVPDLNSLFSLEVEGATGVSDVRIGQRVNGDLSATLRRAVSFSGNLYNETALTLSPKLEVWTCNAFNDFVNTTKVLTVDLQTCAANVWTLISVTTDLNAFSNVANGTVFYILIPTGSLSAAGKKVDLSRLKLQIGELSTEFVDDVSLFVTAPSVDSTMLQDGCIARSSLFLANVVPTAAYQANSVTNAALGTDSVDNRVLATGAATANIGYTPVNKATDSGIGQHFYTVNTPVGASSVSAAAVVVNIDGANASNDGYFPAISFNRPGVYARAVGLRKDGNLIMVDHAGSSSRILDSGHGVDTASIQDGSVTTAKLASTTLASLVAIGTVHMFAGPNIPSGWLACDGTAVSRVTYAALFAAIGTYWGVGDNVNTFNLPDLRGRSPLGYINNTGSGLTVRGFGTKGGEEGHVLTTAELALHRHTIYDPGHNHTLHDPAHTHGLSDPGHAHYVASHHEFAGLYQSGGNRNFIAAGGDGSMYSDRQGTGMAISANYTGLTMDVATSNIQTFDTGSNAAHNNMHPHAVLYFIIKAI